MTASPPPALIDELLPQFDEFERHEILVRAAPETVYAALRRVDLNSLPVVRWLLALRGVPSLLRGHRNPRGALTLERMTEGGFVRLGTRPNRELVLGVIGPFWKPTARPLPLDAEAFRAFERPGSAKVVWDFRLAAEGDGGTRLSTETRIRCFDAPSRRKFRLYWRVVGPFSALIRILMLRAVAREATRPAAGLLPSRR